MRVPAVTGATRLVALLGDPVAHSLSPRIHNHAFASLDLPLLYVPLRVPAHSLHAAIGVIRACGFAGANLTIPHKQAVLPYCDRISALSARTGTVNTLYFDGPLLCGDTTDPQGFFRALDHMKVDPAGAEVVMLGNGGAARTLATALFLERPPSRLTLVGRDPTRVSALAADVSAVARCEVPWALFTDTMLTEIIGRASLLVNCTSVGMYPHTRVSPIDPGLLHSGLAVFDSIYNPGTTQLLADASARGCGVQNGIRMLLYQALASFRLWTGREAPEAIFDVAELQSLVG